MNEAEIVQHRQARASTVLGRFVTMASPRSHGALAMRHPSRGAGHSPSAGVTYGTYICDNIVKSVKRDHPQADNVRIDVDHFRRLVGDYLRYD